MKRALIIATIYPFIDGFEKNDIKILQDLGYEIHTIASGNDVTPNLDELGVKKNIINITRNPLSIANIKAYFFIKRYIKDNNIDLVHCHTPVGGVLGRLCNRKRRARGKSKTIYTAHGFHFYKGAPFINWLIYYPVEKWLSRYTDILITINMEDYARAKEKFNMKRLEYIPGVGVDINYIKNIKINKNDLRKNLSIPEENKIIISVGELSKRKNHHIVIKALKNIENVTYLICGQGILYDYLNEVAKENNVDLRLLGFRKDRLELMKMSDVFVFPSLQEGLPVALMEAMACEIPCIASKIRGNVDLLDQYNFNCFFVSENELRDVIIKKINNCDKVKYQKLNEISEENIEKKYYKLYESVR